MSGLDRAGRLLRTVRHLPPSQVGHRLRLRGQRALYGIHRPTTERLFSAPAPATAGWPAYVPLDLQLEATGHPDPAANADGTFEFLNERLDLGSPIDWNPPSASQLWRFHLHYFDWAWDLCVHPDPGWARSAYQRLYESWRAANPVGQWDAWSPYVVSLRAWTMCAAHAPLVAGEVWEHTYIGDMARHARYLRANLEFDVGGNHLVKNLKALVGLGIFLGDDVLLRFGIGHLRQQVAAQVLPDGGHFERSPSYHAQVLGDLIAVVGLARAAGVREPVLAPLAGAVEEMRVWLATMLLPDGAAPLLNDCLPVNAEQWEALAVAPPVAPKAPVLLPQTGYAVVARDRSPWHAVLDVGPPCPPELPAHAHADALSLVCHLHGQPILVDTGTSTYAADPARRQYERSTAAHNTVVIDGVDSTEVYGAFRAGRRHRVTVESLDEQGLVASHDGYRHLDGSPVHRRGVRLAGEELLIEDVVEGADGHALFAYFHLAPGLVVHAVNGVVVTAGPVTFEFDAGSEMTVEVVEAGEAPLGLVGRGQGVVEPSTCVVVDFSRGTVARLRTVIRPQAAGR